MAPKILTFLTLGALMGACGSNDNAAPTNTNTPGASGACNASNATATTSVSLKDYAFSPACIKVAANAAVIFTNNDAAPHTTTSDTGALETFDSGDMPMGKTFSHTFTKVGTTTAHCTYHSNMHVGIVVQ